MWIFCLLETKICKARRPAAVTSTQFVCVVLVLSPHFPCSACLVRCSPARFWSISCQYYVQRELGNWITVGSTPEKVCFCLFVSKLCDCNPLMKSAELLSALFHHLTPGIVNVAKCSKNPRKLSVCTMWSSLKNNVCNSLAIVCMWHQYPFICVMTKVLPSWQW